AGGARGARAVELVRAAPGRVCPRRGDGRAPAEVAGRRRRPRAAAAARRRLDGAPRSTGSGRPHLPRALQEPAMNASAQAAVSCWIDGAPRRPDTKRHGEITNPATGSVIRRVPFCGAADIDAAVQAAGRALPAWRETPPLRRARVLQKYLQLLQANQRELARLVTEEHGKTLPDAGGSVRRGIEVVEFACGIPHLLKGEHSENVGSGVDCHTLRQPVGVCAGITPFNFPVMVPLWMFPVA